MDLGSRSNSIHNLVKKTGVKRVSILFELLYGEVNFLVIFCKKIIFKHAVLNEYMEYSKHIQYAYSRTVFAVADRAVVDILFIIHLIITYLHTVVHIILNVGDIVSPLTYEIKHAWDENEST